MSVVSNYTKVMRHPAIKDTLMTTVSLGVSPLRPLVSEPPLRSTDSGTAVISDETLNKTCILSVYSTATSSFLIRTSSLMVNSQPPMTMPTPGDILELYPVTCHRTTASSLSAPEVYPYIGRS